MWLTRPLSRVRPVFAVVLRHFEEHIALRAPRPGFPAAGVERKVETLALLYDGSLPIPLCAGQGSRAVFGLGICEEEVVGNVLAAGRALLGQVVGPAEQLQHGKDELLLGEGLVGPIVALQLLVCVRSGVAEFGESGVGREPPVGGRYALGEEVFGEESAWHVRARKVGGPF